MRKQLEALITKMEAMKESAEEKADNSENDKIVDRYEGISAYLDEAIGSIQSAIEEFDS